VCQRWQKLMKTVAIGSHAIEATTAKSLTRTTLPTTAGEGMPGNCNNNENERQRRINDTTAKRAARPDKPIDMHLPGTSKDEITRAPLSLQPQGTSKDENHGHQPPHHRRLHQWEPTRRHRARTWAGGSDSSFIKHGRLHKR
jgi:hypothetical protein